MGYIKQDYSDIEEKFDGRLLFHRRRDMVHQELSKWSISAMKDLRYLGEWCAALMQLHRMLYGSLKKVKHKIKINGQNKVVMFNTYMELKLYKIHKKILSSFKYYERSDGEINIKVDRDKLKDLYFKLDEIQKIFSSIEYDKNLDLPKNRDPVESATTAGF